MRRVRWLLERCACILAVATVAVITASEPSPAWAADRSARDAYDLGYENGYQDGYERAYDDAYRAASEEARVSRDDRNRARRRSNRETLQRPPVPRYTRFAARIESSVYDSATEAGIPSGIIAELIRLFSYQVDFAHDVQPGDELEVIFEPSGILLASLTLSGKTQTLYRFQSESGIEYLDSKGRSAMGLLMRTPVDGAKVSSGFGRRDDDVHEGIDFRVPPGTPVMAAGSGDITFVGRSRGYGNLLVIEHGNGYATAYAHLSRFASGTREGTTVRQGDIVAYSGATGNATGPHLHYEIRLNGRAVNPARVKEVFGRTLSGDERVRFLTERARIDRLVTSLPVQRTFAGPSRPPMPERRG